MMQKSAQPCKTSALVLSPIRCFHCHRHGHLHTRHRMAEHPCLANPLIASNNPVQEEQMMDTSSILKTATPNILSNPPWKTPTATMSDRCPGTTKPIIKRIGDTQTTTVRGSHTKCKVKVPKEFGAETGITKSPSSHQRCPPLLATWRTGTPSDYSSLYAQKHLTLTKENLALNCCSAWKEAPWVLSQHWTQTQ